MSPQQVLDCARTISSMYYYLKVSELMLFFFRFKAGKYGRFYGSVDPMAITSALIDFLDERDSVIVAYKSELTIKLLEEGRKKAVSYEEWQKLNHKSK